MRAGRHELPAGVGVGDLEDVARGVGDGGACLAAHEQAAEVVPRTRCRGRRRRSRRGDPRRRRTATSAAEPRARNCRHPSSVRVHPDRPITDRSSAVVRGWRERHAVAERALAPHRGVARAGGAVLHQRAQRTVGVERAQRDRPVREVTRAVGGAVDRIDDHGDRRVLGPGPAGLLAEHAHARAWRAPGGPQRRRRGRGGTARAIGAVATFDRSERGQRTALRRGRDVEQREQVVGREAHGAAGSTVTTAL